MTTGTATERTTETTTGIESVRIAALADLHCSRTSKGALAPLFAEIARDADVVLLAGDLTDYGLPDEAGVLAGELAAIGIPVVGVLGNHDFESGHQDDVQRILCEAGVLMLDGEACEVRGVGIAGVKGFGGGFGKRALEAWGEATIKQFVREAVDEALKLEAALAHLRAPTRIALMHYAPVRDTVEGEPLETFPFLGSSRLAEPLARYPVAAVFHGHAHLGAPEGRMDQGIPVYNVSMPVLRRAYPERSPFRVIEVSLAFAAEAA